jgi:hypothetical protein
MTRHDPDSAAHGGGRDDIAAEGPGRRGGPFFSERPEQGTVNFVNGAL